MPTSMAFAWTATQMADEDLMCIRSERRISSAVNLTRLNL